MKVKILISCEHSVRLPPEDAEKLGRTSIALKLAAGTVRDDLPDAEAEKLVALGYAEKVQ